MGRWPFGVELFHLLLHAGSSRRFRKIHLAADSVCRPVSRVTSAGQRHDSLGYAPVMDRIRVRRRVRAGRGPAPDRFWPTRRTPARRSAKTCADAGSRRPSRTGRPDPQPQGPRRQRRAAPGVRQGRLQAAQHRRARHQPAASEPCRGNQVRQARLRLARQRRRRGHPDLAPRSRHMIYGTRPSALAARDHLVSVRWFVVLAGPSVGGVRCGRGRVLDVVRPARRGRADGRCANAGRPVVAGPG